MQIKDFEGNHIGFRVIKADRKGGAKVHLLSVDLQTEIDVSIALLVYNGICPDCKMLLTNGVGTNGENYVSCEMCEFFSE